MLKEMTLIGGQTMSTKMTHTKITDKTQIMRDFDQKVLSNVETPLHTRTTRVPILTKIGVKVLMKVVLGAPVPMKIEIGTGVPTMTDMGAEIPIKIGIGAKVLIGVTIGVTIGVKAHMSKIIKEIGALAHFTGKIPTKRTGQICTNVMSAKLSDL